MAPPTDDEILAAEYLRYQANLAGVAVAVAVKESYLDWNVQNPLHLRGPDGRYVDVAGVVEALGETPEGEPGARTVRRAVGRNRPLTIRPELARQRTRANVQAFLARDLERVLGRRVDVELGNRMHVATMRELAEGFLRGAEDWPDMRLERISVAQRLPGSAPDGWSTITLGPNRGPEIVINERQLGNRARFLRRLRQSIESGDNRPTSDNAAYVAAHQFGHLVQNQHVRATGMSGRAVESVMRQLSADPDVDLTGPGLDRLIAANLGAHAMHSQDEMGAEGLADILLNGEDASPLSIAIHRAVREVAGDPRFVESDQVATPTGPRLPTSPVTPNTPAVLSTSPPRRRASAGLRIAQALNRWAAAGGSDSDDPLEGIDREPLRRVARDYGIQLRRGASIDDIKRALLDHTRSTAGVRADPDSGAGPTSLTELFDSLLASAPSDPWGTARPTPQQDASIRAAFGGEFAGMRAEVSRWSPPATGFPRLTVEGTIYNQRGLIVGRFSQDYARDRRGKLIAHHGLMSLDRRAQGSGFATTYGMHLLNYYRESGVAELHTLANIDVGGYTWARGGFDFANTAAARTILGRLDRAIDFADTLLRGAPNIEEQKQAARDLLARARAAGRLSNPDFPTAFEISQLGRWDGAGKDDMWIGKKALLGSSWEAVLRL